MDINSISILVYTEWHNSTQIIYPVTSSSIMSLDTISSMLSKTITTWSLSSSLFTDCYKHIWLSRDLQPILIQQEHFEGYVVKQLPNTQ